MCTLLFIKSKEEFLKLNIRLITPSKWHEMEDN
ncbi:hypothetical protein LCGC14_2883830, partial [marine sediment metagenome]